ncbi:MAG TPA: carbamoyl-phosphate synthase large subunit [Candidatus Acidoferrales bacterium]|jgi:carbamoyl-phosphate synthase large subunit|nr:carbamoyl-phosphate synthase large subunit [Candidatus Acidoferrales bacterium]
MPRRNVMVIGSGPIVIGQAAEFDYAGVQACRALREEGHRVVLVNSNPATIMTDPEIADAVYLEPLAVGSIEEIIAREAPDALLPTLGGQTGLNLAVELEEAGVLRKYDVELLGTPIETIRLAEDRAKFKLKMQEIGEPVPESAVVTAIEQGVDFARRVGYPLVVRPAYTLAGTGGGIVYDELQLRTTLDAGLNASLIHQALLETSLLGWKEIEYEVLRDGAGNCIVVCNMENIDPVGVHTGDSIVVAPSQTLSDLEYQMLRSASINVIRALEVQGGCNIQFALRPDRSEYAIIEVNPRVSRSSALASKATGYPIAKISTRIALGQRLDEIPNPVTGVTRAAYEPTLDYVVVKFPRWPFDKFPFADTSIGTQMKSTGEAMGIGRTFRAALLKAVRGLDLNHETLTGGLREWSRAELETIVARPTHERLFAVCELLRRAAVETRRDAIEQIHALSDIDRFWLYELAEMVGLEERLRGAPTAADLAEASSFGYSSASLTRLSKSRTARNGATRLVPAFRMVDTAAAEFPARSPYYYLSPGELDEMRPTPADAVVVVGSGPIRIGQGIEFDYSCVHAAWALKDAGHSPVVINNNPETVSTDFDISDALVFEPPGADEVEAAYRATNAIGVMLAFGGQTAINLAAELSRRGVKIIGSDRRSLDMAENREQFDAALARLGVARPQGKAARSFREARAIARELGFPVLVRPSFVLGGRAMEIVYNEAQLAAYAESAPAIQAGAPLLVDKYIRGLELEVDAIFDGDDILIPGIFEHLERAGVHSGDSISVYPVQTIDAEMEQRIAGVTHAIARELRIRGLINIQFVLHDATLYIIEANPRASRTVPIIQKATGINLVAAATRIALGEKLADMEYGVGLRPHVPYVVVKVPVFSFAKMLGVETVLGPEMKSTGEVLGIDDSFGGALRKGFLAAGIRLPGSGGRILVSIADEEKDESIPVLRAYAALGHTLVATPGTHAFLESAGITTEPINKIADGSPHVLDLIASRSVDLVINDAKGPREISDDYKIRRAAVEANIACLTSLDTARALAEALASKSGPPRSLQEYLSLLGFEVSR